MKGIALISPLFSIVAFATTPQGSDTRREPPSKASETSPLRLTQADTAAKVDFDIPEQPLEDALAEWSKQSGLQVLRRDTDNAVELTTASVTGKLSPAEALEKMLAKTGLRYEFINDRTVRIAPIVATATTAVGLEKTSLRLDQNTGNTETGEGRGEGASLARDGKGTEGEGSQNPDTDSEKPVKLEEIVVTAQKRLERLEDVPAPVTVIAGEPLATHNQLRLQDYYSSIPGLGLALTDNNSSPVVTIRGVFTGPDTNPTTGVVVDEISYGTSVASAGTTFQVADIDPGDISRIEVLRGPQGTLYGAASIGGIIKYVTVDPSTEGFSGRIQVGGIGVSHGDDVGHIVRGNVNVPLGDTFAVRLSGFTTRDPGFIDNAQTGEKDTNFRDSTGGRASALWQPSDRLSLKLSAMLQDSERHATQDVDVSLGEDPKLRFLPDTGEYRRKAQVYSATLQAKVGGAELTSATGYNIDESTFSLDLTRAFGGFLAFLTEQDDAYPGSGHWKTSSDVKVEKFVQELRASLPIGEKLNWLVGGFYTHEKTTSGAVNLAVTADATVVGQMSAQRIAPVGYEEYAAFSTLTVDITDRLDLQFGGRYAITRANSLLNDSFRGGPFIPGTPRRSDDEAFTYLVTPRLRISPNLMVYARLASGYRPGGGNELCGKPNIPCSYDPDNTQNYDIGVKGSMLDGALSFDAAVYYIDWKDIQINQLKVPNDPEGNTFTGNASHAKSQGVELSVESKLARGTRVSGWVVYNDAELTEDFETAGNVGFAGDRLPYGSRFSANLSLDQEFPLWGTTTGSVGTRVGYVGDRRGIFQPAGLDRSTFPSYVQWDLSAGMKYDTWDLDVYVNNVTDKRGVLRGGADGIVPPDYFTYIQPRTIGLSLSKFF